MSKLFFHQHSTFSGMIGQTGIGNCMGIHTISNPCLSDHPRPYPCMFWRYTFSVDRLICTTCSTVAVRKLPDNRGIRSADDYVIVETAL